MKTTATVRPRFPCVFLPNEDQVRIVRDLHLQNRRNGCMQIISLGRRPCQSLLGKIDGRVIIGRIEYLWDGGRKLHLEEAFAPFPTFSFGQLSCRPKHPLRITLSPPCLLLDSWPYDEDTIVMNRSAEATIQGRFGLRALSTIGQY
jgi:hypothetical protein